MFVILQICTFFTFFTFLPFKSHINLPREAPTSFVQTFPKSLAPQGLRKKSFHRLPLCPTYRAKRSIFYFFSKKFSPAHGLRKKVFLAYITIPAFIISCKRIAPTARPSLSTTGITIFVFSLNILSASTAKRSFEAIHGFFVITSLTFR